MAVTNPIQGPKTRPIRGYITTDSSIDPPPCMGPPRMGIPGSLLITTINAENIDISAICLVEKIMLA
jgi:hypothetical protein